MSLPKELLKPIDEIKTPSNQVLVISLMLALTFAVGLYIKKVAEGNNRYDAENERLRIEIVRQAHIIDSLKYEAYLKSEEERIRLIKRIANYDSLTKIANYINRKIKPGN